MSLLPFVFLFQEYFPPSEQKYQTARWYWGYLFTSISVRKGINICLRGTSDGLGELRHFVNTWPGQQACAGHVTFCVSLEYCICVSQAIVQRCISPTGNSFHGFFHCSISRALQCNQIVSSISVQWIWFLREGFSMCWCNTAFELSWVMGLYSFRISFDRLSFKSHSFEIRCSYPVVNFQVVNLQLEAKTWTHKGKRERDLEKCNILSSLSFHRLLLFKFTARSIVVQLNKTDVSW